MAFPFYVFNVVYPVAGFKSQTHVYNSVIVNLSAAILGSYRVLTTLNP